MAQSLGAAAAKSAGSPPPPDHNGLNDEIFAKHVSELAQIEARLDEIKGLRRSARKRAKAAGIDLGHMDAVVRMADWSQEEVREFFGTQVQYALWFRLPIGTQAELFADEVSKPTEAHDAGYWAGKGYQAGIQGHLPAPPDECHPEFHQDFKHGWDQGQATLAPKKLKAEKPKLETVN